MVFSNLSSVVNPRAYQKVAIFIDGTNFYNRLCDYLKSQGLQENDWQLNLHILVKTLVQDRQLLRTYFYTNPGQKDKMAGLIFGINGEPKVQYVDVKLGTFDKSTKQEKRVDTLLVVDLLKLAYTGAIDTVILISADEDFIDAVRAVKDLGKHVEIVSLVKCNAELKKEADVFTDLSALVASPEHGVLVKRFIPSTSSAPTSVQ